jgi:hypothetical protein
MVSSFQLLSKLIKKYLRKSLSEVNFGPLWAPRQRSLIASIFNLLPHAFLIYRV